MISEALQRPLGPLAAWQWGVVIGGGYLGYRLLTGKSVFPTGGSSSSTSGSGVPTGTGTSLDSISQGPQGDPGPIGPPGPIGLTGPPGGTTAGGGGPIGTTTKPMLDLHQQHLLHIGDLAGFKKTLDAHWLHIWNTQGIKGFTLQKAVAVPKASPPVMTPGAVASMVNPPSTTVDNAAPVMSGMMMPSQTTAVSVSREPLTATTIPVSSGTG